MIATRNTFLFLAIVSSTILGVCLAKDYYTAAVVEYHRERHHSFESNKESNLPRLLSIVENTVRDNKEVDIIALPETVIVFRVPKNYKRYELKNAATYLPDKNSGSIVCTNDTSDAQDYVKEFSCLSRKLKVYIAVDLIEKTYDDVLFNTAVVFDRNGQIVSKYRKMYMFNEPFISNSSMAVESFTTDFGVTFGVFICFDVFFERSFRELIDRGVSHFLTLLYWYSPLPYYTSIHVQSMWAYKHNVALLAAGANDAETGTTGSGIYLGRAGSAKSLFTSDPSTKVIVERIPKAIKGLKPPVDYDKSKHVRGLDGIKYYTQDNTKLLITSLEKIPTNKQFEKTICDGDFCCAFTINVNDTSGLAVSVHKGRQDFEYAIMGTEHCAVIQCEPTHSGLECDKLPADKYFEKRFTTLRVQAMHNRAERTVEYYPYTVRQELHFVPYDSFRLCNDNILELTKPVDGIYTFGFLGRDYALDVIDNKLCDGCAH